ncbi:MAG: PRC-barrel domain containing protein [Propioniciclava sp.]|nr:PRC-barrel domain containing protein [Propioniciclava sp.]
MFTDVEFDRIHGAVVFDRSGHRIGNVAKVYLDDATGAPMWVTVHTGLFGLHSSFVPLADAHLEQHGRLVVPHDRAVVEGAPTVDQHGHLAADQEEALYAYYGVPDPHEEMASARRRIRRWVDDGGPLLPGD